MLPSLKCQSPLDRYGADGREGAPARRPTSPKVDDSEPLVQYLEYEDEDLSPGTSLHPRSSVDTYASTDASEEDLVLEREEELTGGDRDYDYIPPLPSYHHDISEPNVYPSTPKDFAQLFPSMNRLSIRHDDFTTDGNMNLRVDTIVPGGGRRRTAVQLFHLRMYDLARRDFSLRRYSRDSGREVCNSKRTYVAPSPPPPPPPPPSAAPGRPTLQRSVSSAMKSLGGAARPPQFRRHDSGSSAASARDRDRDRRPPTSHSHSHSHSHSLDAGAGEDAASVSSRRTTGSGSNNGDHRQGGHQAAPRPTNSVRLEFSNYARVDVRRKGSGAGKRYEFEWWGHRYAWRRAVEKHLGGVVSFHLVRDGRAGAVAHIVPETRSPTQVDDDERAGGWVPPCHMWINDSAILDAATDVADVVVATGLMALVDDCIKERWQTKKIRRIPVLGDVEYVGPRAFMQRVFSQRRTSSGSRDRQASPPRYSNAIPAF